MPHSTAAKSDARPASPHCTAVGKALLAYLPADEAQEVLGRTGMDAHTEHTITDARQFAWQLEWLRGHGYALTHCSNVPCPY